VTRYLGAVALLVLTFALGACSPASGGPASGSSTPAAPAGAEVRISADKLAFDAKEVAVEAGKPVTIVFENKESIPHNVAVYADSSASQPISVGEIFSGPATKSQQVPALAPGSYFFRCDLHPDMTGSLIAE
jgi:plastocyanin